MSQHLSRNVTHASCFSVSHDIRQDVVRVFSVYGKGIATRKQHTPPYDNEPNTTKPRCWPILILTSTAIPKRLDDAFNAVTNMLSDEDLKQTASQLAKFSTANEEQHSSLTEVLMNYKTLMQDYKRLKSDYEEERDSRERYKQMARAQERSPFVLVLIDGDGYVFDDDLVSNGADGGQKAAALLNAAITGSLRSRGLEHCRIMVRVYANLSGLSKVLSTVKLAGPEKRSLAPFVSSFNRSNDLFDFVDAGELKENADFKIKALFRHFVEIAQCRHIYFAGCHDVGYISELTPHANNRDRITLIRLPAFHKEFGRLGLRVEDFPNLFRSTTLQILPQTTTPADDRPTTICTFYQKGICTYGNSCRRLHVKKGANGISDASNGSSSRGWRSPGQNSSGGRPFSGSIVSKSEIDFMRNNVNASPVTLPFDLDIKLPEESVNSPGNIPVNKDRQRLDAYLHPTTPAEWAAFNMRIHSRKLCNNHYLLKHCSAGETCPYDHSHASASELKCLRQVVRNNPCPRKGGCRALDCLNGHICQKAECKHRGGNVFCKIPAYMHHVDLNLAAYEPANMPTRSDSVGLDDDETYSMASGNESGTLAHPKMRGESSEDGDAHESGVEMADESPLGSDLDFCSSH